MVQNSSQSTAKASNPTSLRNILSHERNILHLLVYKSKNQHRRSVWYKWLRMLKSSLERLTVHIDFMTAASSKTKLPNKAKLTGSDGDSDSEFEDSNDGEEGEEGEEEGLKLLKQDPHFKSLIARLQTAILPGCHKAFTHLITSTQYSGIAMVMLGCLSKVYGVLEPFMDEDVTPVIETLGNALPGKQSIGVTTTAMEVEDIGEVISRDAVDLKSRQQSISTKTEITTLVVDDGVSKASRVLKKPSKKNTNQKSQKRDIMVVDTEVGETAGTTIDDLFAGFL